MSARPHVVLSAPPPQGHLRGLCILAAKLAVERAIDVTLLLPNGPNTFSIGQTETSRVNTGVNSPEGTLRVVAFGEPFPPSFQRLATAEKDAFEPVWKNLLSEQPIKCSVSGKEHPGVAKPTFVVLHPMQYALYEIIRGVKPAPAILAWKSNTVSGIAPYLLPPRLGGVEADMITPFTEDEIKNGRSYNVSGKVVQVAGLPAMYDWELHPQDCTFMGGKPGTSFYMGNLNFRGLVESDGIISAGGSGHDSEETITAYNTWAKEGSKEMFFLGPMRPFKPDSTEYTSAALQIEADACPPGIATKVSAFLDKAMKTKGINSVIYICFGTMFWPVPNPDFLWTFIDALSARDIPFVLSHPTPFAKIPENIQSSFGSTGTGNGLIVPWAPQHNVLSHQAVGWFLNQGGAGSTMDALTNGVPMIGWPFLGDQPSNVAYLVHNADVAFEFTEARTGPYANKTSYTTGKTPTCSLEAFKAEVSQVLDDMAGGVGARKRENAQAMKKRLAKAWSGGGSARIAFDRLTAVYGL